ncbi:hypothetical protein HDV06_005357 [Boothiomyces sp. JEL0866]|nr:hypothetical protein HDV06_005357 [Boothiomyces sp. JEL0866]
MTVVSLLLYIGKIAESLLTKVFKETEKKWSPLDTTCTLCFLTNIFRMVQLLNIRSISFKSIRDMTDDAIVQYVQVNILMDFIYYGTGVLAATVFVSSVVGAAAGVNLYSDIKLGNYVISTSKVFAIFRIVVLIVLLTFNISWATLGTSTSIENYIFYRRAGYVISLCVVVFVTVPLLVYFSNNVLRLMIEANTIERGTGELVKAAIKDTNYATKLASEIDQVPTPISVADLGASRISTRKNKIVPSLSIKALKSVKKITLEEKISNFRFAINTSSVVGAAAGVDLYSDVKIGQTVIPTSKVFAVIRVVILILLLTFNICWAMIGTHSSKEAYILYRRGGFLISLLVIVFITTPLLIYFSNKVLLLLKSSIVVEKGTKGSQKVSRITANYTSQLEDDNRDNIKAPTSTQKDQELQNANISPKAVHRAIKAASRTDLERKIYNFRFAINTTIWFLYFLTACNLTLLILGMELDFFQNTPNALVVLKASSDFLVWLSCSFMLLYLYFC